MFIYVHVNTRTSAASDARLMQVCCERCGGLYRYRMVRRGVGKASTVYNIDLAGTEQRAARNAQAVLGRLLERGVDPVPCPHCGWLQWHMVQEVHRRRFSWIGRVGWIIFCICAPFWLIDVVSMFASDEPSTPGARIFFTIIWSGVGLGLALRFGLLSFIKSRCDPNDTPNGPMKFSGSPPAIKPGETEVDVWHAAVARRRLEPMPKWHLVQRFDLRFPMLCCRCMKAMQLPQKHFMVLKHPVPMCAQCWDNLHDKRLIWSTASGFIALAATLIIAFTRDSFDSDDKDSLIGFTLLGMLFGVAAFVLARFIVGYFWRPVAYRRVLPELGTVEMRFKNPLYQWEFVLANPI